MALLHWVDDISMGDATLGGWHLCTEIPHWILFFLSELLLVQFFLVSVIYITKKLTLVMTPRINRLSQKFQLWGNQLLLTSCNDKLLRVFNLSKPDVEPQMMEGHNSSLRCAVWISNYIVASCAEDCEVRIWDVHTSKTVTVVPTDNPVMSMEMSRDGELLTVVNGKLVTFIRTSR
ncbi:hypothetical protein EMCRGX_G014172 [Ephydatia muelleri]